MAGDDATRLQLVELRAKDGPVRAIRFAPRLSLVTGFGPPERLASWIATSLAGPRPFGVDGVVAVAGRYLTLGDLPPMLLAPQASLVVSDADLEAARRRIVEPRHARVVERRESVQQQRAREEQSRKMAAARFADLERRLADVEPTLADAIEQGERAERRADTSARLRERLESVDAAVIAAQQPHPEAIDLAAQWELFQRHWDDIVAAGPALPLDIANEHLQVARAALQQADQRRAFSGEAPAVSVFDQDSGAARARDDEEVRHAEAVLEMAEAQLRRAEKVASLPSSAEIAQRQFDIRSRSAAILGRFPGDDVPRDLREFRPGVVALRDSRAALAGVLDDAGIEHGEGETAPDEAARAWLEEYDRTPFVDYPAQVATLTAERDGVETDLRAAAAELVAVAARLRDLDRTLGDLAVQEARLSEELASSLGALGPDQLEEALRDTFDEFLAGARGPGRLPIVVGGITSAFDGVNCERAIRQLERVSRDVQVIVVADRPAIEAWVRGLGDGALVWSPDVASRAEAEEREWREEQERARHAAEQRAVQEAEDRARRDAEERDRRSADQGRDANARLVDLSAAEAAETVPPGPDGGAAAPAIDWNAPATPVDVPANDAPTNGASTFIASSSAGGVDSPIAVPRATRPAGEDLEQRRRRAEQITADATRVASETNRETVTLHCDVHRNIETSLHCARCNLPFCDQCLALLGEPPALHCVDCALELSGARSGRNE